MSDHLLVLLVQDNPRQFESLRKVLSDLSIETYSVTSCKEAADLISQCKPHIVFTQSALEDGSWQSVQRMAEEAKVPLSVIVVGAHPDTRNYVSVMERGAFDFVAPPFEHEPMRFVVRSAALDAQRRREASTPATYALNHPMPHRPWAPKARDLSAATRH